MGFSSSLLAPFCLIILTIKLSYLIAQFVKKMVKLSEAPVNKTGWRLSAMQAS